MMYVSQSRYIEELTHPLGFVCVLGALRRGHG